MSDVSCRIIDGQFAFLEHLGVSLERIRRVLPIVEADGRVVTEALLRDPRQRVTWNTYVKVMRASEVFERGDPAMFDEFVRFSFAAKVSWLAACLPLLRLVVSPRRMFQVVNQFAGAAFFAHVVAELAELPDGRIRITLSFDERFDDLPAFFEITQRVLGRLPTLAGYPPALVRLTLSPRRGVFDITPPTNISWLARIFVTIRIVLGSREAMRELSLQHETLFIQYTDSLRTESALRQARAELESRVAERTMQLRQAEERAVRFGEILDGCQQEIYILDPTTLRYLKANLGAARATGYTQEELQSMGPMDVSAEPSRIPHVLRSLPPSEGVRFSSINRRRNGETYPIEIFLQRSRFEGREAIICIVDDITKRAAAESERNRLMAEMLSGQHLQTIGTLAGGLAHEFNNILTPILAHTAIIARELPAAGRGSGSVERIEKAVIRGRDLVKQILDLSRPGKFEPQAVRLDEIAAEVVALMRPSLPRGVQLVEKPCAGEALVMASPVQLHQVILNLVTNAAHALGARGGTIEVAVEVDPEAPVGRRVRLRVADDGAGMDEATLQRAFEPFFTTKEPGKGTGLGLSIIRDIVTRHGGEVEAASAPGCGSTFLVLLPAMGVAGMAVAPLPLKTAGPVEPQATSRRPRIMLVDDEVEIAHALSELLGDVGYDVVALSCARQALERLMADASFDLVVSDISMPGMTGLGLARALRERHLDVPICLLTGFNHQVNADECARLGVRRVFEKPVEPARFIDDLASVLNL